MLKDKNLCRFYANSVDTSKQDQEIILPKKYCFYTTTNIKKVLQCLNVHFFFLQNRTLVVKIGKNVQ